MTTKKAAKAEKPAEEQPEPVAVEDEASVDPEVAAVGGPSAERAAVVNEASTHRVTLTSDKRTVVLELPAKVMRLAAGEARALIGHLDPLVKSMEGD